MKKTILFSIMKTLTVAGCILFVLLCVTAFSGNDKLSSDTSDCLQKVKSVQGEKCGDCNDFKNSYTVYFVNVCDDTLDIKVAVQNLNKTWKIFEKENMAPHDTLVAWSCEGSGKFLKWVKKSGDRNTIFPTNMDIYKCKKDTLKSK
jgi:hypothetical protein